jgi:hypothetical protein
MPSVPFSNGGSRLAAVQIAGLILTQIHLRLDPDVASHRALRCRLRKAKPTSQSESPMIAI